MRRSRIGKKTLASSRDAVSLRPIFLNTPAYASSSKRTYMISARRFVVFHDEVSHTFTGGEGEAERTWVNATPPKVASERTRMVIQETMAATKTKNVDVELMLRTRL